MKWLYKILRSLLVTLAVLVIVVPGLVYAILSLPVFTDMIADTASTELTKLLGVKVNIKSVDISPFNRVALRNVTITDSVGTDTIASIGRLGAGIELSELITRKNIVINYVELIDLDARLNKADPEAPLNIQPIIEALKPKDPNKPPTKFDFKVQTIIIRRSKASYDILSAPKLPDNRFDPNHISINDLRADLRLPRMTNDDFTIDLKRLAMDERSGLSVTNLSGLFHITSRYTTVSGFKFTMPGSYITLEPLKLEYESLKTLGASFRSLPVDISIPEGCHLSTHDFAPLLPALEPLHLLVDISLKAQGHVNDLDISACDISLRGRGTGISLAGGITGLTEGKDSIYADVYRLNINASGTDVAEITESFTPLSPDVKNLLHAVGKVTFDATGSYTPHASQIKAELSSQPGNIALEASSTKLNDITSAQAKVNVNSFDLSKILPPSVRAGEISFTASAEGKFNRNKPISASGTMNIDHATWHDTQFNSITADIAWTPDEGTLSLISDDADAKLTLIADAGFGNIPHLNADMTIERLDLRPIVEKGLFSHFAVSGQCEANLSGNNIEEAEGHINLTDIVFIRENGEHIPLNEIDLDVNNSSIPRHIQLKSDLADIRLEGDYRLKTIYRDALNILASLYPSLINLPADKKENEITNDFMLDMTVKDLEPINRFKPLPLSLISPLTANIIMEGEDRRMSLAIDAPYILQKNKLIENSSVRFDADAANGRSSLYLTTMMPTKNGPMTLTVQGDGHADHIDSDIEWLVARNQKFDGRISTSATFSRNEDNQLLTRIDINPGNMTFNDTVWTIHPATVDIAPRRISVNNWVIDHSRQNVIIDGVVSADPEDVLNLNLADIDLDYIFGTLNIPNVMFGGHATGHFTAAGLFSGTPRMSTSPEGLKVRGLSYNNSLMGDAVIASSWHPDTKAVTIDADISQANGCRSTVRGEIKPMVDSLDFRFDADRIGAGFLQPFMAAFSSSVSGYVSGKARLWGSFKNIDMVGDMFADGFKMKLDFTNTYYSATDSIRLNPGNIEFHDVMLTDSRGNTAFLNGYLKHKYFKEPEFEFRVSDARNFLVYDVKENSEHPWYGRVFANGSASVTGRPGEVAIDVNMTTASESTFAFVLSEQQNAGEYTFITFRDRTPRPPADSISDGPKPELLQRLRAGKGPEQSTPTHYSMNIAMDVTPVMAVTLVMDPVGGDRIRANGSGNLRMSYDSRNEDLRMFGTYNIDRGNYNFTLQDIILKDFSIEEGSSISFHGDPYAAQLNITAAYQTTANLTDLDESFATDKDLNRTTVPVKALLKVTGDMRQPDLAFDIDLPTLSSDIRSKVMSVINTDEMMNRQIIYLLALNRFYTPDYMNVDSSGNNELVSMASSTLSSRLSNALGGLSDTWSIAPNIRSDRGDFSDIEVDVALSSHLLNNRLLLNGNFGYRDNTLNNSSFVGDFDIEYLLNRAGTIRLKAYNRYNDQNFYVKSALTTQGVGVVFKRDFDNLTSWLRPLFGKKPKANPLTPAKRAAMPADSTRHGSEESDSLRLVPIVKMRETPLF